MLIVGLWEAAQERKEILTKMQDGKLSKYKSNPYALIDGRVPFGYRKADNPNGNFPKFIIEENPEEVRTIRKIFELVLKGKTLYNILSYLIERNIKIRRALTNESIISKLVKNELYKGIRIRKRTIDKIKDGEKGDKVKYKYIYETYEQHIKAIISEEDFEKAQEKVKQNLTTDCGEVKYFNPLRWLMKCRCGRSMIIKDKRTEGLTKLVYRCSCNEVRNNPKFCEVNRDEVSYNFTVQVTKSLFKQKCIEIRKYLESKGNEKELELQEVIAGTDERMKGNEHQKVYIQKEIDDNIKRALSITNDTILVALSKKQDELDKELKENKKELERLQKQKAQYQIQLSEVRSIYSLELDERAKTLKDEDLEEIYHTFLEKVEYYCITTMKGFYEYYFKSGQVIYVALSKVRCSPKAVVVNADVNTTTGDIKFKYQSSPMPTSIKDFRFPEDKEQTVNITDKGFFTSEWLNYAFATELALDLIFREEYSEKIKAQGGYKERNSRRHSNKKRYINFYTESSISSVIRSPILILFVSLHLLIF